MTRSPVGAVVRYHGSKRDAHGEYVVFAECPCDRCAERLGEYAFHGDDEIPGMRYALGRIGPAGPQRKMRHVRRSSFTVVQAAEDSVY